MFAGHGLRDNVAQVYRLRLKSSTKRESKSSTKSSSKNSNSNSNSMEVIVSNIHVLFNPKRGDIKLGQVRVLMDLIMKESMQGSIPVIMCGDWNSAPYSGVYDFVSTGRLDFLERDRRTVSGQIAGNRSRSVNSSGTGSSSLYKAPKPWKMDEIATALGDPLLACAAELPPSAILNHDLELTSSYRHVLGNEPQFTTAHDKYIGTVDYIFFSKPRKHPQNETQERWHIEPHAVLLPPPTSAILPHGLPRGWFGSDHICLFVQFGCTYR
jgi:mRNA deadenylase 3'-5' endonuclease subunit Ccr4